MVESFKLMCPLYNGEIVLFWCDRNGGILTSQDGIKLTMPKGAINDGDLVNFYMATSLCG